MAKESTMKKAARTTSKLVSKAATQSGSTKVKVSAKKRAQDKFVQGQRDAGRIQLSTWVPKKDAKSLQEFIRLLREQGSRSRAFENAFPGSAAKIRSKKA